MYIYIKSRIKIIGVLAREGINHRYLSSGIRIGEMTYPTRRVRIRWKAKFSSRRTTSRDNFTELCNYS